MSHTAAITRLQSLPAIFRGADLTMRFGWTSKTASQYLYLWKRRKLVQGLGGHSDVFANLLQTREPDWEAALRAAMPSAVVTGVEALRRAGWTTQVPARPSVTVNAAQPVYKSALFDISVRPADWFSRTRPGHLGAAGHLPVLAPGWALADLLHGAAWGEHGLWPDDIEWSVIGQAGVAQWQIARAALGMPPEDLFSLAAQRRASADTGAPGLTRHPRQNIETGVTPPCFGIARIANRASRPRSSNQSALPSLANRKKSAA